MATDNSAINLGNLKTFKNMLIKGSTLSVGVNIAKASSSATIPASNASALWAKLNKYSFPFLVQLTGTVDGDTANTYSWMSQSQVKSASSISLNFEHMQGVTLSDSSLASMQITVSASSGTIMLSGTSNVALSNLKINIR